jgi:hypothetical protein
MALLMAYQEDPGGTYTYLDPASFGVRDCVLKFSDSHPAQLSFGVVASQETFPLGYRWFLKLWDTAGTTPDGAVQSFDNPAFEGHVWEIEPAESNLVRYVAYDPSMIAGREIPVMSTDWPVSAGAGLQPVPDSTAVPRVIFNNTIFNDVDAAYERASDQSIGDIIATVMTDAVTILHWFNAAPSPVGTSAYINSELSLFSFEPQAKVVATNESLRQFIDRLTQTHYPEYAFLWTPGTRLWHWYSRLTALAETVTLNQPTTLDSGTVTTVLSMELHRSLEGCYPAVEFRGPETSSGIEEFSTLDGTLATIGTPTIIENYIDSGGIGTVVVFPGFQIVDPDKRRGAKLLPSMYFVRDDAYHFVGTKSPTLLCTFDGGDTWQGIESVPFDFRNGIAYMPKNAAGELLFIYYWSDQFLEAGSTRNFWTPNGYKLIWAPMGDPITIRYPATGFAGTSYTVAGMQTPYQQYDEMLAVGYNRFGIPVTTATRAGQFQILAQAMHRAKKDIVYTGGMLLEGIVWDFCRLNKTINIAAVDHNGSTVTTGWESLAMLVTDVEYNFADMTTSVTFSQSALAAWGDNVDLLKQRLRLGNGVEMVRQISYQYQFSTFQSPYTRGKPISFVSGITYTDKDLFYDRNTGTTEEAL